MSWEVNKGLNKKEAKQLDRLIDKASIEQLGWIIQYCENTVKERTEGWIENDDTISKETRQY